MTPPIRNSESEGAYWTSATPNYSNGVFYYDEIDGLAGYPERRGHKSVEEMDHGELRQAVEWALDHRGEWRESLSLVEIQHDQDIDLENASDSGIEL